VGEASGYTERGRYFMVRYATLLHVHALRRRN
jgi:hypothetical protein